MSQPVWRFVGNIGDVDPLEYGGFFVYVDETGVYPPEAEVVELQDDTDDPHYLVYRFPLDPCAYVNGILSDSRFHPDHAAWFADGADSETIDLLQSDDPQTRAWGYRNIGDQYGYINFDNYPLKARRRELRKRYEQKNGVRY